MPWFPRMQDEVLPALPVSPAVQLSPVLGWVTNTGIWELNTSTLAAQAAPQPAVPSSGAHFHGLPAKTLHVQSCLFSTATANHFLQLKRERERTEHSHPEIGNCSHYSLPWGLACSSFSITQQTFLNQLLSFYMHLPNPNFAGHASTHWTQRGTSCSPPAARRNLAFGASLAASNCRATARSFLSTAWSLQGRIPNDSTAELLLRAAAIKKGKSTPTKENAISKKSHSS